MNRFMRLFLKISCWSLPPCFVALIAGFAVWPDIHNPIVRNLLLICLLLNCITALFSTGLCMALYERYEKKKRDAEMIHDSFEASRAQVRLLTEEAEKLTGMREIQMSSHIESFSDLLKNILKITHIATEARALTIYLESRSEIGSTFPKAHMLLEPADSTLPGECFIFLNEEVQLITKGSDSINGFAVEPLSSSVDGDGRTIKGVLLMDNRPVGEVRYCNTHKVTQDIEEDIERLKLWSQDFEINASGVFSCWQTRSSVTHEGDKEAHISVPILSQGLMVGVLSAQVAGLSAAGAFSIDLRKLRNTLLDYGRNIGQPLKKEELYEQAIKDGLTGLYNKTHYETQLNEHFHRMKRYGRDLSFIFVDIDHFKKVNDTYGHLTGDMALKAVASILRENIRKSDMAFRIGGEELAVLLLETEIEQAIAVAEKLRSVIEETEFPTDEGRTIHCTASFGVACMEPGMKDPHELVAIADKAVYEAKETGRNRVIAHGMRSQVEVDG